MSDLTAEELKRVQKALADLNYIVSYGKTDLSDRACVAILIDDFRAAVLAEREACAQELDALAATAEAHIGFIESAAYKVAAEAIRART